MTPGISVLALPVYEEAYVTELFNQLLPGAIVARANFIYEHTRARWQTHMRGLVSGSGTPDASLPTYEQAYVLELYNTLLPGAQAEANEYILQHTPPSWQASMQANLSSFTGSDTVVQSYATQVISNGGWISGTRIGLLDTYVKALKTAGCWPLMDDAWLLVAENAPQALTSLKQRRLAVAVGSPLPVFAVDQGYAFDGLTNYIATGFIPATHGVAMNANTAGMGSYGLSNENSSGFSVGVRSSSNRRLTIRSRLTGSALTEPVGSGGTFTLPVDDARGLTSGGRAGPLVTDAVMYRNATALVRTADPTTTTALPVEEIYIGGVNAAGVLTVPRPCTLAFVWVGAMPSPAQMVPFYNAVQAYMTAIGANV